MFYEYWSIDELNLISKKKEKKNLSLKFIHNLNHIQKI